MIRKLLSHPLTRGLDVDDPRTTELRFQIIREKPFLKQLYSEWYQLLKEALAPGQRPILELGSGAGFLKEFVPGLVTSEVLVCPGIQVVLDGQRLPFSEESLAGIVMTNVLHHIPEPRRFLAEAGRCVRPGGILAMIEPWVTPWSRWVYSRLHTEPLNPDATEWEFPLIGPLSGANVALPWIIFERDRERFLSEFPQWRIQSIRPLMPVCYLVSGGVSLRSSLPGWIYPHLRAIEELLPDWSTRRAMFALIVLHKTNSDREIIDQ